MADPYWRYTASADRGAYSGYMQSDASALSTQPWRPSHSSLSSSSDYLQKDILRERPGAGIGALPEPSSIGYPSTWEDSYLIGRRDAIHRSEPGISNILNDKPESLRKADGVPVGGRESNVLFVDGLPSDCSRREVSHLFRPFPGFQEIRLVHKEPRHSADKPMVLCFVEFSDPNHAITALEALQGYKFDNKKPDSPALRIQFAHFPFQLPSDNAPIPSQPPPDNAHFSSQPAPNGTRFLSHPPLDSAVYPSKLPHDSAHFSSQQPSNSHHFPSQLRPDIAAFPSKLPLDSAHFPSKLPPDGSHHSSQLPSNSAHLPSQLPPNSAHSPFQLPSRREEQDLTILREKELAVQDEEPVVKTMKLKSGPSKKKEREDANKNKVKKWCIKCKQNHYGECYNFKGCYICGQTGHIGKECTSKPRLCFGCGEPGHKHSVCPNGPRPEKKSKKEAPPKT